MSFNAAIAYRLSSSSGEGSFIISERRDCHNNFPKFLESLKENVSEGYIGQDDFGAYTVS